VEDIAVFDNLAKVGDGGIQEFRRALNLGSRSRIANLEPRVHRRLLLDVSAQTGAGKSFNARSSDGQGVVSGRQRRYHVSAVLIRGCCKVRSTIGIGDDHLGGADGCIRIIRGGSTYARGCGGKTRGQATGKPSYMDCSSILPFGKVMHPILGSIVGDPC